MVNRCGTQSIYPNHNIYKTYNVYRWYGNDNNRNLCQEQAETCKQRPQGSVLRWYPGGTFEMSLPALKDREGKLYDEQFDIEYEVFKRLEYLIGAKWDSDTLKLELQQLVLERDKLLCELYKVQDQMEKQDEK